MPDNAQRRKEALYRRAAFRAALTIASLTAGQWAEKENISRGHLSMVLRGVRESPPLIERIEKFCEKHGQTVAA